MIKKFFRIFLNPYFWVSVSIVLGFLVRLYKIDNPIADWHSWRQADTAAVSRNFYKEGFSPFLPKYDDMSGVAEKPYPNTERYRLVEFPIYNTIVYLGYLINGGVDERIARLVSIAFALGSIVFIYLIASRYFGKVVGVLSSMLYAILPFNIYFTRVILPEPALVFFCLGMFYFVNRWIFENKLRLYLFSVFFTACAFLLKPMAIFYLLPLAYSYFQKERKLWPIHPRYVLWAIPSFAPFLAWRFWIQQFPEGIPASNWLLNGNGIRFRPSFWRWIIGDRFGREILSVTGTFLFFIGLLKKPDVKSGLLLHLLAASSFLYLIVFATGNVQHDYYQTLIVPALVIFTARGFVSLIEGIPGFLPRIWTIPIALLFLPLTLYFCWYEVKGLYQINNGVIVDAGRYADKILPKNAVVIAPYQGDTSFLYQVNRPGWAYVSYPTKDLKDVFKATHYISVNYDAKTKWLMKKYKIIEENPKFVILDLSEENPDFYKNISSTEELTEPM